MRERKKREREGETGERETNVREYESVSEHLCI